MAVLSLISLLALATLPAPQEFTAEDFARIRARVELDQRDRGFESIPWKSSLVEAMAEARATDKPVFLWLYFGDPRHTSNPNGMRSRQFVCSDPEVVDLMQHFVPFAGSDVDYGIAWQTERMEYKALFKMFGEAVRRLLAPHAPFEGHWMMTSTGEFLAGATGEESLRSAALTAAAMREALHQYRGTPHHRRVLAFEPTRQRDGLDFEWHAVRRPDALCDLQVVSRFLPFAGMSVEDSRHPEYSTVDQLWFLPEEAEGFLPSQWQVGARAPVSAIVRDRIARLHLGSQVPYFRIWTPEEVENAELESELIALDGEVAELRFVGRMDLHAKGLVRYQPQLRGAARYDRAERRFLEFELIAAGPLSVEGVVRSHCRGAPEATLGVLFTNAGDREMGGLPPLHWDTGYPRWITAH